MTARPIAAAGILMAVLAHGTPAAAWGLKDDEELTLLRAAHPHTAQLVEQGDALAESGALAQADALFRSAEADAVNEVLPWRRDCEARTALGERRAAIEAGVNALERRRSSGSIRATVGAYVEGAPTTPDLLFQALSLAGNARYTMPWSPTASLASCDIALSIGDVIMLQRCTTDLESSAPGDPITRRSRARLDASCPPWRFWTGWLAVLAAVLGTLGHAAARRLRALRRTAVAAAAVMAATLAMSSAARADEDALMNMPQDQFDQEMEAHHLSRFPVDDKNPQDHIPSVADRNADPMQFGYWLQDLAAKATLFSRRGDHATAARLYETMIAVVPERAIGHVLLCQEYEALREPRQAINACGDALLVDGAQVKDYLHFVGLLLAQPGDLSPKEILVLDQVLKHMRDEPAAKDVADEVECEIGTRTMNLTYLETCTTNLAATAPDDVKTITFQWTYAIGRGRFGEAETLVERAKAKGVGASTLEQMQRKMLEERERSRKRMAAWAGAILLALATVILGGRELSRRLKAARRASAPPPEAPSPSTLAAPDVTPGAAP